MSDLDRMLEKLKKKSPKEEIAETKEETKEDLEDFEDLEEEEMEKDDLVEEKPTNDEKVHQSEPIPAQTDNEQTVESEVGVLQNNGIYRRELLLTLKELVDVHKVNTQTLIDIKKRFDAEDGTKEK